MPTAKPRPLIELEYFKAGQEYLKTLPLEHFTEAGVQGVQREITLESLHLIRQKRPDVHYFNELAVQYRLRPGATIRRVVPDNLVVLHKGEIAPPTTYDVELQPARPFWTLEYVSKGSTRKDYEDNFDRYEKELEVPYYLLFYPDNEELTLYRRRDGKYVSVKPNRDGRLSIKPIETQVAILGGWVRYWFRGELVPLPSELQTRCEGLLLQVEQQGKTIEAQSAALAQRDATLAQRDATLAQRDATLAQRDATLAQQQAEIARLRAMLKQRGA